MERSILAFPVSSIFKWEREINIAFSFRLVPTVLCPKAGLNQGRLLKLDLGYTEPGEQVKVNSGCHTCCVYWDCLENKSKTSFREGLKLHSLSQFRKYTGTNIIHGFQNKLIKFYIPQSKMHVKVPMAIVYHLKQFEYFAFTYLYYCRAVFTFIFQIQKSELNEIFK